jgi:phage baseplate assembly protein W
VANSTDKAFLGVGWGFPVALDVRGDVRVAAYEEDIRQAIFLILETNPGERVMRPDFGAGLKTLVFEPLNNTTIALCQHKVEEALILWEPRITVIDVRVTADPPTMRLDVAVDYQIRSTNTFYNLVYPFYLQEGRA